MTGHTAQRRGNAAALCLLVGAAVTVVLGVYAREHDPALRPLLLVGFSGMIQLKTWLATTALVLVVAQLVSALWMWGRLPGVGGAGAPRSDVRRDRPAVPWGPAGGPAQQRRAGR